MANRLLTSFRSSARSRLLLVLLLTLVGRSDAQPPASAASTQPASRPTMAVGRESLDPLIKALGNPGRTPAAIVDMIAAGADVNGRDPQGRSTALYYATWDFHGSSMLPVVKAMVERGADVKARCIGGFTPLHNACGQGSVDVVEYLISKGADVKAKDDTGVTPLHVVARRDRRHPPLQTFQIIRVLVKHGADVNAIDRDGETPRDYAVKWADEWVATLLGELGGK